jgi:hypothetical protein
MPAVSIQTAAQQNYVGGLRTPGSKGVVNIRIAGSPLTFCSDLLPSLALSSVLFLKNKHYEKMYRPPDRRRYFYDPQRANLQGRSEKRNSGTGKKQEFIRAGKQKCCFGPGASEPGAQQKNLFG